MDRTHATVYVPWVREMTEDMVKEGWSGRAENFSEGLSLEEASVLIG